LRSVTAPLLGGTRQGLRPMTDKATLEAAAEIRRLSANLSRRKPIRKAPISSQPMTPELAEEIRDYWKANPGISQPEIGTKFNVNQGRVSEAVRGHRR